MKDVKWKYPAETLHLVLKYKWWDMINGGNKMAEYRDIQKWARRICTFGRSPYCKGNCKECGYLIKSEISSGIFHTTVKEICFHRGYTSKTLTLPLIIATIDKGYEDWGAPAGEEFICLKIKND